MRGHVGEGLRVARVFDVAERVLEITGYVSTMKLQKLVYYCNALSLVLDDEPLFPETFQAWVNGPVCPSLFSAHRGRFVVGPGTFAERADTSRIGKRAQWIIGHTLEVLGGFDGNALSELTHHEAPWLDARGDCGDSDRCSSVITDESIKVFYSSSECKNPLFSKN